MKKTSRWISIAVISLSVHAGAMILPPNNLKIHDNVRQRANLTQSQFNEIIDGIIKIYAPIAASHGATLRGVGDWSDSTVNAYADQAENSWAVHMFGGLARREEITPDGFALVMCHEIGHHLGGYAYYDDVGGEWAAVEGQADYFATHACGKKVFAAPFMAKYDDHEQPDRGAAKKCKKAWRGLDREICFRQSKASQALANLLALVTAPREALTGAKLPIRRPKFETPDRSVVSKTYAGHPAAQCRLDTYLQASLCQVPFDDRIIPGKGFAAGINSRDAELDASMFTCFASRRDKVGNRPLCWFKPQI